MAKVCMALFFVAIDGVLTFKFKFHKTPYKEISYNIYLYLLTQYAFLSTKITHTLTYIHIYLLRQQNNTHCNQNNTNAVKRPETYYFIIINICML